jgi:ketosteroid isomerase-like protein
MGPVRWTILRRAASPEWAAVEGWLDGTQKGKPFRVRFSTWLKIRDGQIVHHIDYLDYAAMRRQIAGTEPLPAASTAPATVERSRDTARALRVVEDFYRRYEAMPVLASSAGVTRFAELLADDFTLEDPTARLRSDGREPFRKSLADLVAKDEYGTLHWEIDRRVTDGEWVAVEGTWRGTLNGRPFATRFTTWLHVRGEKIAHQIDYMDHITLRKQTTPK